MKNECLSPHCQGNLVHAQGLASLVGPRLDLMWALRVRAARCPAWTWASVACGWGASAGSLCLQSSHTALVDLVSA